MATIQEAYQFLSELKANNNREWFHSHKSEYENIKALFKGFATDLIYEISKFDPEIKASHLTPDDCMYRIYRDLRFSKDKLPYKTHIGIFICKGGKKSPYSGYYFHIEPYTPEQNTDYGFEIGSILCAGIYRPEPKILKSIREEISVNGDMVYDTIKKAKEFSVDWGNALKKTPAGFNTNNNEWNNLLKLKDFALYKNIDKQFLFAPDLVKKVASAFKSTRPFIEMLNKAVQYAIEEQ